MTAGLMMRSGSAFATDRLTARASVISRSECLRATTSCSDAKRRAKWVPTRLAAPGMRTFMQPECRTRDAVRQGIWEELLCGQQIDCLRCTNAAQNGLYGK